MGDRGRHRVFITVCVSLAGILMLGLLAILALSLYTTAALPAFTPTSTPSPTPIPPPPAPTPHPIVTPIPPTPTRTPHPIVTPIPPTPIPLGRLELTYPSEMAIEEVEEITLEIILNPEFAEIGVHPRYATGVLVVERGSKDGTIQRTEETIQVYPVMSAELIAASFDISPENGPRRHAVTTEHSAVWLWQITAKKPGTQRVTINIYGETVRDSGTESVVARIRRFRITVSDKPLPWKIVDAVLDNLVAIVSTGGPLGLILAYITYRANQESKELKERIQVLEETIEQLQAEQRPT